MPFYFQAPVFGLVPVAPLLRPVPYVVTTHLFTVPPLVPHISYAVLPSPPPPLLHLQPLQPPITFHLIFHGTRRPSLPNTPFCTTISVPYASPPSRALLLANLSYFSRQSGLGDRVYSGQAVLYLTRDAASPPVIAPGAGIEVSEGDVVRRLALREEVLAGEFAGVLGEAWRRRLGVFVVVDVDAREEFGGESRAGGEPED